MAHIVQLLRLMILTMERTAVLEDGALEVAVLLVLLVTLVDLALQTLLLILILQLQTHT